MGGASSGEGASSPGSGATLSVSLNGTGSSDAGSFPQCTAAGQCVHACSGNGATTVSGTVYDPAGKNPLYGIVVYIPSQAVSPITTGASCYSCGSLYTGSPIAYAVTDSAGHFTITGVPDGDNIPLVLQVGKWRKQITVPTVAQCTNTALADKSLTLPKNQSEGDIPAIGIATGGADTLECLLRRIGLDASEYASGSAGPGRIHIFVGDNGANTTTPAPAAYSALWDSTPDLTPYDILLLACEGHETTSDGAKAALTPAMLKALYDYAQGGGRVFTSHYQYAWFTTGPFKAENLATWATGGQDYAATEVDAVIETLLPNGQTFPRGVAMQQWLGNVGALNANGELPILFARHNALVTSVNTASVPWITADQDASPPNETEYFSFDTPFGADAGAQCGRVVYSDLHVGAASTDYGWDGKQVPTNAIVPDGCADADLSAQEKALEFMLFDLSSCVAPPTEGAGGVPVLVK
jgi:hypothetical protein